MQRVLSRPIAGPAYTCFALLSVQSAPATRWLASLLPGGALCYCWSTTTMACTTPPLHLDLPLPPCCPGPTPAAMAVRRHDPLYSRHRQRIFFSLARCCAPSATLIEPRRDRPECRHRNGRNAASEGRAISSLDIAQCIGASASEKTSRMGTYHPGCGCQCFRALARSSPGTGRLRARIVRTAVPYWRSANSPTQNLGWTADRLLMSTAQDLVSDIGCACSFCTRKIEKIDFDHVQRFFFLFSRPDSAAEKFPDKVV